MEISSALQSVAGYVLQMLGMGAVVFFLVLLFDRGLWKNKKFKRMGIAAIVLYGFSFVTPLLSALFMLVSSLLMMNDSMSVAVVMGSAWVNVAVTVVAYVAEIASLILSICGIVSASKHKKQKPPVQTQDDSAFAEQPDFVQDPMQAESQQEPFAPQQETSPSEADDCSMSIGIFIVLWMLTFGIGYMYWIYRMTKYLNRVPGEKPLEPVAQCLLCGFVPFYSIYWFYVHGQKLEKYLQGFGRNENLSTLCLVLGIFCPLAAGIIMQDCCNKLREV